MALPLIKYIFKNEKIIFQLFDELACNMQEAGVTFLEFCNQEDTSEENDIFKKLEDIEHKGDTLTHEVFKQLVKSNTIFEREDIFRFTTSIDA